MSAPAIAAIPAVQLARPKKARVKHRRAIFTFVLPFGTLFALFYLVPIGYAIQQSLLVIERDGTFGQAREVFGGLSQYALVFQNGPFWNTRTYCDRPPNTSRAWPNVPSRSMTSSDCWIA